MYHYLLVGLLTGCVAAVAPMAIAQKGAETPCVVVTHMSASECAVPGEEISIAVTLSSACDPPVQALGLRESLPDAWVFKGMSGSAEPDIGPVVDSIGTLEFVWISVPDFPASFSYRVLVPANEATSQTISGMAEYRQTAGALTSATTEVLVCLEGGGEGEGEGEGEGCTLVAKGFDFGKVFSDLFLLGITLIVLVAWRGAPKQR